MKCQIGSLSDEPCPYQATHIALQWARCNELHVCAEHADEALSDGAEVEPYVQRD